MTNCYIICDNDSPEFVIIGTEEQAEAKRDELAAKCLDQCIRMHGTGFPERGRQEFERHYWHLHTVPYEILTPAGVAVYLQMLDGETEELLIERIRNFDHA